MGGILRFMGVDSNSLGVIALNVLIMFAEWVKNTKNSIEFLVLTVVIYVSISATRSQLQSWEMG